MNVVAVTRILDEADIVEAFTRHTAAYVSHHIFADNGSCDGTMEILAALRQEGLPISVIRNTSPSYSETVSNTHLFYAAAEQLGADWVLFLDTDEFIDDRGCPGGLDAFLASQLANERATALCAPLTDYRVTSTDVANEAVVPLRMTRHSGVTDNTKIIVRGSGARDDVTIANGSHDVLRADGSVVPAEPVPGLTYAHYAERSLPQYVTKFVKGWAKVLAAGRSVSESGTSGHYRGPFDALAECPGHFYNEPGFNTRHEALATVTDPISYKGGPLRYTPPLDEVGRAIRSLCGYLRHLSEQHGRLLDESPEARDLVAHWNAAFETTLGSVSVKPAPSLPVRTAPPRARWLDRLTTAGRRRGA